VPPNGLRSEARIEHCPKALGTITLEFEEDEVVVAGKASDIRRALSETKALAAQEAALWALGFAAQASSAIQQFKSFYRGQIRSYEEVKSATFLKLLVDGLSKVFEPAGILKPVVEELGKGRPENTVEAAVDRATSAVSKAAMKLVRAGFSEKLTDRDVEAIFHAAIRRGGDWRDGVREIAPKRLGMPDPASADHAVLAALIFAYKKAVVLKAFRKDPGLRDWDHLEREAAAAARELLK
jgi:hypothetical protein